MIFDSREDIWEASTWVGTIFSVLDIICPTIIIPENITCSHAPSGSKTVEPGLIWVAPTIFNNVPARIIRRWRFYEEWKRTGGNEWACNLSYQNRLSLTRRGNTNTRELTGKSGLNIVPLATGWPVTFLLTWYNPGIVKQTCRVQTHATISRHSIVTSTVQDSCTQESQFCVLRTLAHGIGDCCRGFILAIWCRDHKRWRDDSARFRSYQCFWLDRYVKA